MYILNIASTIKKMTVNELRNFFFEKYYKRITFSKENSYHSMEHQKGKDLQLFATKVTKNVPDPSNAKEYYNSYLKRRNTKTSHKLSKTEKVSQSGSSNSLYSKTKKVKIF